MKKYLASARAHSTSPSPSLQGRGSWQHRAQEAEKILMIMQKRQEANMHKCAEWQARAEDAEAKYNKLEAKLLANVQ